MAVEIEKVIGIHNLPRGQYSPDAWVAIDNGTGNKCIPASEIPGGSSDSSFMIVSARPANGGYTPDRTFAELNTGMSNGITPCLRVLQGDNSWMYYDLYSYTPAASFVFRAPVDYGVDVGGDNSVVSPSFTYTPSGLTDTTSSKSIQYVDIDTIDIG